MVCSKNGNVRKVTKLGYKCDCWQVVVTYGVVDNSPLIIDDGTMILKITLS